MRYHYWNSPAELSQELNSENIRASEVLYIKAFACLKWLHYFRRVVVVNDRILFFLVFTTPHYLFFVNHDYLTDALAI